MQSDLTTAPSGLGPLEPLPPHHAIADILVNNNDLVYNEKYGQIEKTDIRFRDDAHLMRIIEQPIPRSSMVHLLNLQNPDMAIVDLKIGPDSRIVGRELGDIDLPEDCVIAAVLRGPDLIIPSDTTELHEGDDVIAIAHSDQEDALRRLLG